MFNALNNNGTPFQTIKRRVLNRSTTTVAVGQVMALDTTLSSTSTTSGYSPTVGTSVGNAVTATAGPGGASLQPIDLIYTGIIVALGESATAGQIYCVVTNLLDGTGLDGQEVEVCIQGRCQANVASATYVVGSLLMMSTTETNKNLVALTVAAAVGSRPIAIVEVGGTTITSATVMLFGFAGILSQSAIAN